MLVRDRAHGRWSVRIFDHYNKALYFKYECKDGAYQQCIPYNEKTWMLLMTTDDYKEGGIQ